MTDSWRIVTSLRTRLWTLERDSKIIDGNWPPGESATAGAGRTRANGSRQIAFLVVAWVDRLDAPEHGERRIDLAALGQLFLVRPAPAGGLLVVGGGNQHPDGDADQQGEEQLDAVEDVHGLARASSARPACARRCQGQASRSARRGAPCRPQAA